LPSSRPFTIGEDYDARYATSTSRFAAYLAGRAAWFRSLTNPAVPTSDVTRFAEYAFRIALEPIMTPGYVRTHPRIHEVTADRDPDDRLAIVVRFAAPLPGPVAAAIAGQGWRDWDRDDLTGQWCLPHRNDRPAAHTLVTVVVPTEPGPLPTPEYEHTGTPRVRAAKAAVGEVCRQLNRALGDVFTALDNPPR
jgi:hypothetical protein